MRWLTVLWMLTASGCNGGCGSSDPTPATPDPTTAPAPDPEPDDPEPVDPGPPPVSPTVLRLPVRAREGAA